jgi:nucleoside-diphosphate-sugar epimerase
MVDGPSHRQRRRHSRKAHALFDAGESVVVLDNLDHRRRLSGGAALIRGPGDESRVAALIAEHRIDAIIHSGSWNPAFADQPNNRRSGPATTHEAICV